MVTALRLRNTKKGERYASFQLEDRTGFVEILVWPDVYRRCMETLVLDDPILVHGRLEVGEERVQIIANEVTPMAQASQRAAVPARKQPERDQNGERVHFYVRGEEVTSEELGRLHETLLRYPGPCTVFLHLALPDKGETVIELPVHLKVARTRELLETVESLFGNRISPLRSP